MKTYYFINSDVNPDRIFGFEYPCCLDHAEVSRRANEWGENVWDDFHEATESEIAEYGVYDS